METTSEIKSILAQVKRTSIEINVHATGHFISKAQLEALEAAYIALLTPETTLVDPFDALSNKLELLQLKRVDIYRKLRTEIDPIKRSSINYEGQKLDSEIAKIKRVFNVSD